MTVIILFFLVFIMAMGCYFFFAPFYLEINIAEELYRIRFHRFASVRLKVLNGSLILEITIVRWVKQLDLGVKHAVETKSDLVKKNVPTKNKSFPWKPIKRMLKSFRINKFYISIDSGNNQLNGILYPFFYLLALKTGKSIQINFIKENQVNIEIENSLARMSWAYISSYV